MSKNTNANLPSPSPVATVAASPLLDLLRRAADDEQLRLQPLPEHAAAKEEEYLRQHYALLLAALLTAQPQVSESQSRLFMLLLDALKLGDRRAALFEQARELAPDTLLEAARLIRDQDYAEELLVDAMVLLRLDAPLSDETAQLLGELAAFLGLAEDTVRLRSQHAAQILGIGENDSEQLAKNWPQRIPDVLTKQALQQGLKGGLWYLDQDLSVNFHWQAEDAVLIFAPGVTLNTAAQDGETLLQGCHLHGAGLVFIGEGSLTLDHCQWQGDYATPRIALESQGIKVTVTNSRFATRNANALTVEGADLNVKSSQFIACGSAQYRAGAIWHRGGTRIIDLCRFEECVGSHAGALYFDNLWGVQKCEFIACRSTALQGITDLAVYTADGAQASPALTACVFLQCSLSIGSAYWSSKKTFVTNSQFRNGNLYYNNRDSSNTVQSGCTFSGGQVIEKEL